MFTSLRDSYVLHASDRADAWRHFLVVREAAGAPGRRSCPARTVRRAPAAHRHGSGHRDGRPGVRGLVDLVCAGSFRSCWPATSLPRIRCGACCTTRRGASARTSGFYPRVIVGIFGFWLVFAAMPISRRSPAGGTGWPRGALAGVLLLVEPSTTQTWRASACAHDRSRRESFCPGAGRWPTRAACRSRASSASISEAASSRTRWPCRRCARRRCSSRTRCWKDSTSRSSWPSARTSSRTSNTTTRVIFAV